MEEFFLHMLKEFWEARELVQQLRALIAQMPALLSTLPCPGELMPLASLGTCIHVLVCAKVHTPLKII